jgi:porin
MRSRGSITSFADGEETVGYYADRLRPGGGRTRRYFRYPAKSGTADAAMNLRTIMSRRPCLVAGVVSLLAVAVAALLPDAAAARDRATGDWNGVRTALADHGVDIEVDYVAESYVLDDLDDISYLGDIDATVSFDTEKLHAWPGGVVVAYFQNVHGSGFSDRLGLLMPQSNYEADPFVQLSEFWLLQQLGSHVVMRLGKQDSNRDFASPRFAGNFVNSSYGVLPGVPLPSFPAPALGVAVLTSWNRWFGVNGGVYEGDPHVESFAGHAFDHDAGVFAIGALVFHHDLFGQPAADLSVGGWTHSGLDRSGVYGIYDVLLYVDPHGHEHERSVQGFLRGAWSPEEPGEVNAYVGGGLTAHGFLGRRNTVGIGFGHARTDTSDETFVEVFYKWRPEPWFTVEPDVQVYDGAHNNPVFVGVRLKIKL